MLDISSTLGQLSKWNEHPPVKLGTYPGVGDCLIGLVDRSQGSNLTSGPLHPASKYIPVPEVWTLHELVEAWPHPTPRFI